MSNVLIISVCFKIFFLIDHHCKTPQIRQKLLKFLQGVLELTDRSLIFEEIIGDFYENLSITNLIRLKNIHLDTDEGIR